MKFCQVWLKISSADEHYSGWYNLKKKFDHPELNGILSSLVKN